MRHTKKTVLLLVVILSVTLATAVTALRTQNSRAQRNIADDQMPIIDYAALDSTAPEEHLKRQRRSKRYDNSRMVVEPQKAGGSIVVIDHSIGKMPALPVNLSDVIVIGNITDAHAHLSNDKSGVYTEFTIRVDEILKDTTGSLQIGWPILAQRIGGRVRFPSGVVQKYGISYLGMPRTNRRYALFLKKNDDSDAFIIVTGYELRAGEVHSLDGVKGTSELPQFAAYKGMNETKFLSTILTANVGP